MFSRANTRRRPATSLFIADCAFAEDCRCSKTGYVKKGFMENHLERNHPGALGLKVFAPYCPACDQHFASKSLLFDHIMNTHVHVRKSLPSAPAVSNPSLPTASSLSPCRTTTGGPSYSEDTPNKQGLRVFDTTMVDQQGYPDDVVDRIGNLGDGAIGSWTGVSPTAADRVLDASTDFPCIPSPNTPGNTHSLAQRFLPQTPMVSDREVGLQGSAYYHHERNIPGQPGYS